MAERKGQAKSGNPRFPQLEDLSIPAARQPSVEPMSDDSGQEAYTVESRSEKDELIAQVLELQNTLHDLSQRVNSVKEENSKLKAENQVLNQYIENLMVTSGIFKSTSGK